MTHHRVLERMKRLTEPEQEEQSRINDHNYSSPPELDMCASSPEDLSKEVEDLRKHKQGLCYLAPTSVHISSVI